MATIASYTEEDERIAEAIKIICDMLYLRINDDLNGDLKPEIREAFHAMENVEKHIAKVKAGNFFSSDAELLSYKEAATMVKLLFRHFSTPFITREIGDRILMKLYYQDNHDDMYNWMRRGISFIKKYRNPRVKDAISTVSEFIAELCGRGTYYSSEMIKNFLPVWITPEMPMYDKVFSRKTLKTLQIIEQLTEIMREVMESNMDQSLMDEPSLS